MRNIVSLAGDAVAPSAYEFYDGVTGYDGVDLYQSPAVSLPINYSLTSSDTAKWADFVCQDGFELLLLLTPNLGAYAEIGIITAGVSLNYNTSNPSPGFIDGLESYSVEKQTSNGGFYIKNRDVVSTYSGSVVLNRADFLELKTAVKNDIKSSPTAWQLLSKDDNSEFLTYSRLSKPIDGARLSPDTVTVSLALLETV